MPEACWTNEPVLRRQLLELIDASSALRVCRTCHPAFARMSAPAPRHPTTAEIRRQLNRDARRLAQAAWRALSPAQRCSADTVSTILSLFSLTEIARASTVCRGWRAGASKVARVSGFDGRVFNAAKKITAAEAAIATTDAQRRYSEALKHPEPHDSELIKPVAVFAEDPLQVGSRLRSLLSSPLRRHVHTLDESIVDSDLPQRWSWDRSPQPVSPPRRFYFSSSDRWTGSWSLAELRGLSALPQLTRLLDCTVQLRDFVFRSVATARFEFPRRLTELSLHFEWSEPAESGLGISSVSSSQHSAHKADLATCLPIMQALVGCSALTSLLLQTTLPLQFDLIPLAELPSLTRLSVDCPVAHCADRLHFVPALRQVALVELTLKTDVEDHLGFLDELERALFTRPHKLDGLSSLVVGWQCFSESEIEALMAAQ